MQAQIKTGVDTYKKHFGRAPRGMWLPECAYRPRYEWSAPEGVGEESTPVLRKGIEEFLAENNIAYFVADAHLLKGGQPLGTYAERFGALRTMHETAMGNYRPESLELRAWLSRRRPLSRFS